MAVYNYDIVDTLNGSVHQVALQREAIDLGLPVVLVVAVDGGIDVHTSESLDAGQQTTLTSAVNAHTGAAPPLESSITQSVDDAEIQLTGQPLTSVELVYTPESDEIKVLEWYCEIAQSTKKKLAQAQVDVNGTIYSEYNHSPHKDAVGDFVVFSGTVELTLSEGVEYTICLLVGAPGGGNAHVRRRRLYLKEAR